MIRVKYPFAVRHDGIDYAAGEVIEIEDTTHMVPGAIHTEHVSEPEKPENTRKRGRTAKTE